MFERDELNKHWEFKQSSQLSNGTAADNFYPVGQFPTVVHLDLLKLGLIPDPYLDDNELKVLWVNEADWIYRNDQLIIDPPAGPGERIELVFEGLDTAVEVFLDGQHILSSKDMFISHRVDITDHVRSKPSTNCVLELKFTSAIKASAEEHKRIDPTGKQDTRNKNRDRMYLRKAQYHWGWDWGPSLATAGPWKPIYVERYTSRIRDIQVQVTVSDDLEHGQLQLSGKVDNANKVSVKVLAPSGDVFTERTVTVQHSQIQEVLTVSKPVLWYPFQHGEQPLYTVVVEIAGQRIEKRIGFRRVQLIEEPLESAPGTSFTFEINNKRIFCGGSNWIPADMFIPRTTKDEYLQWVKLAKRGNHTMIRAWGGGVFEDETFYKACDEEGILVWQDFLFACGNYPAEKSYMDLVEQEVRQFLVRSTYHPSICLLCGNNEDYAFADLDKWGWDEDDEDGNWLDTAFPAREIYERLLPKICSELAPDLPYRRSSPYGGPGTGDRTVGDTHIWEIWHGPMAPYQDYDKYRSRFPSEFGFESPANLRVWQEALTNPKDLTSQGRMFDIHDKCPGNRRRYGMYLSENMRFDLSFENYVYCTQLLQSEAMGYAVAHFRRGFKGGKNNECSGALIWQLNDIWPSTSWALVDVHRNPKPAFYAVKRALEPITVSSHRVVSKEAPWIANNVLPEKAKLEIWASSLEPLDATLAWIGFDIASGTVVLQEKHQDISLLGNVSQELISTEIPNADETVVGIFIRDKSTNNILARSVSWPEPMKYITFAKHANLNIRVGNDAVYLDAKVPLKGVRLAVPVPEGEEADWDDNCVDLVPGDTYNIAVSGLNGRSVQAKWLCDWEMGGSTTTK